VAGGGDATRRDKGSERVETCLIAPLREMGLRKQRRQTAEALEEMFERMRARLSYMSGSGLETLREAVLFRAGGKARNLWPDEVSIYAWAHALEPAPVTHSPLVRSYMASAAGRRAWARDPFEAAALLRYLKRAGAPEEAGWSGIARDAERMRDKVRWAERSDDPAGRAVLAVWAEVRAMVARLVEGAEDPGAAE